MEKTNAIKDLIIKLLFNDKKELITEVTIKKEVSCYNVNIQRVVLDINRSGLYPFISSYVNGYGVLTLVVQTNYKLKYFLSFYFFIAEIIYIFDKENEVNF